MPLSPVLVRTKERALVTIQVLLRFLDVGMQEFLDAFFAQEHKYRNSHHALAQDGYYVTFPHVTADYYNEQHNVVRKVVESPAFQSRLQTVLKKPELLERSQTLERLYNSEFWSPSALAARIVQAFWNKDVLKHKLRFVAEMREIHMPIRKCDAWKVDDVIHYPHEEENEIPDTFDNDNFAYSTMLQNLEQNTMAFHLLHLDELKKTAWLLALCLQRQQRLANKALVLPRDMEQVLLHTVRLD
jgi:hypothetical protein